MINYECPVCGNKKKFNRIVSGILRIQTSEGEEQYYGEWSEDIVDKQISNLGEVDIEERYDTQYVCCLKCNYCGGEKTFLETITVGERK